MNRLDRLTAILIHLQTKRVVRAQELADRFGTSLRTIYRDVRSLEEAGIPIGAEAGVGYFLENYHLPPVMFTNAEASALVFGAKLVAQYADASVQQGFDSALYKIKSVLKGSEKEHLDDLDSQLTVLRPATHAAPTDQLLNTLQAAIVGRKCLLISYQAQYSDVATEREVDPIGLVHYSGGWHLIAHCQLRQDYRDFRTDRIKQINVTGRLFQAPDRLSLTNYLERLRSTAELTEVWISMEPRMARFAHRERYGYGFIKEETRGDRVHMQFLTQYTGGLCRWLLMYGQYVRLESPDTLRTQIQQLAQEAVAHWQ
ncbi:helix-turn-helix transcriptional regulator [Fibrella aquatilis]|uniref:YafY family transcriptional regulator n=1 Tax=Fibrella aquatilis TaxID=2817059 RepID=A0A939G538_9BACT|nr:YafY family protein [Fibrella aquatilis]MBO0930794.1 YafY family transcriptional regulator [Fibrella aquatilis]